jgi:hypothetical protein
LNYATEQEAEEAAAQAATAFQFGEEVCTIGARRTQTSRFRGVYKINDREGSIHWQAYMRIEQTKQYLGTFDNEVSVGRLV